MGSDGVEQRPLQARAALAWAVRRESTESAEMPLACIGWASAIAHSRPSIKDTKQPTTNHLSKIDGGVSGAEESGRKGVRGCVKFADRGFEKKWHKFFLVFTAFRPNSLADRPTPLLVEVN